MMMKSIPRRVERADEASALYCISGIINLIIDNHLSQCQTGVRAESGNNTFRGNVIVGVDVAINSDSPDFFLGPNRCLGGACQ
ncbi:MULTISPECIES: hypothetical protein [unclassified Wenzhouxiangella]|uniref:hypothetical protein n=1 Tax=unclassified Wenzhouxiangella TaxID=2613841 RepID=UPI000E32C068|nr:MULTISPECIES: hypothetical protein [unclassified Wenzhouxiangella]RFF26817.1 hypothetical protein DZK25_11090 [Wenzhouxiangella sp. 15181]RFP69065.1 hypothetical protein DZK26_05535 [Wenzhouxiangella sp. 15190]